MKLASSSIILLIGFIYSFYRWINVRPRTDWTISSQFEFEPCQEKEVVLVFGATSMLGRYLVDVMKTQNKICLVSMARSHCKQCDINIKSDFRDIRVIERAIKFYSPQTVITAVKPPLTGIHYKVYIEVNLLSMVQLIDKSVEHGVKNFIYVSSIAAAGHYFNHHNSTETEVKPYYTDYEAPYDVSKRFAEDYLLAKQSEEFNTIALRLGGVIGGEGDPFEHLRYPVLFKHYPAPPGIDVNYAGNIAEAISVMYKRMKTIEGSSRDCSFCGEFYYYTGVPMTENEKSEIVSKTTGKPMIPVPFALVQYLAKVLHWLRFDPNTYSAVDLMRMAFVHQTFDQSKFYNTFPEFKQPMTLAQALDEIYSLKSTKDEL